MGNSFGNPSLFKICIFISLLAITNAANDTMNPNPSLGETESMSSSENPVDYPIIPHEAKHDLQESEFLKPVEPNEDVLLKQSPENVSRLNKPIMDRSKRSVLNETVSNETVSNETVSNKNVSNGTLTPQAPRAVAVGDGDRIRCTVSDLDSMSIFVNSSSFNGTNACLENEMFEAKNAANLSCQFNGTVDEGEPCHENPTHTDQICKAIRDEGGCIKPTHLICNVEEEDAATGNGTCIKAIQPVELFQTLILDRVDEEGCLLDSEGKIITQTHISKKLHGGQKYLGRCDARTSTENVKDKCKSFTQVIQDSGEACLKNTHLYCDAVLRRCLCGFGKDENQFQYNENHDRCYIRPTFDVIEGFECANGSSPFTKEYGKDDDKHNYTYCRCDDPEWYPPHFNSENPKWWRCAGDFIDPSGTIIFILFVITQLFFNKQ